MNKIDMLTINTLRFLSAEAIQKANSGHPGLPLGAAPAAYALWAKEMKANQKSELGQQGQICTFCGAWFRTAVFSAACIWIWPEN